MERAASWKNLLWAMFVQNHVSDKNCLTVVSTSFLMALRLLRSFASNLKTRMGPVLDARTRPQPSGKRIRAPSISMTL